MSKLYFRYGAMNSGKSTNLMQVAHNYEERGMKVIIIKPKRDSKGGDKVISRLGVTRKVDMLLNANENVYEKVQKICNEEGTINCILVDEVQFLKKEQIDQLFEIAVKLDIPTICYGLRTDFQMNGFEGSTRLLLLAHSIEELKTICSCGKKAALNGRKINGKFVFEGEQIAIDKEDNVEYESLCPKCFLEYRDGLKK
ncbi:thymidine kinase [Clostridium botulinum]|uniref:Thymidine kinase n=1 Tax=Clostridium botulinum C/D str. DC5 TaxID=1443128 RepID=A0A0A0ID85_CLOBO|nr:thymidine kinase [Clostridium botulinum]KEI00322.1 thymidine kinase [Clostridium botulinum C/D str. BKT75002]KEI08943.1 thymidine kinase [Clostridium botulinum C/D str. BKT2873]KGM93855.1 thymidine kinase [Clostridium botulinum D str. CCUG 7971]KGM99414.1 thymidine kinase [Clostridium botulinum C/D str. DC5]KOC51195.1 thymidine kinase [Clostridium botulinum]